MLRALYSLHYSAIPNNNILLRVRGHLSKGQRIFVSSSLRQRGSTISESGLTHYNKFRLQSATRCSSLNKKPSQWRLSISIPVEKNQTSFQISNFLPHSFQIPNPQEACSAQSMLRCMHYFGSTAFAYNGATIAGSAGMHVLGCTIVGTINAVGGGTIRDILTGNMPIFWGRQPQFLFIGLIASFCTFLLWPYLEENDLNWEKDSLPMIISDACGVASISIVGAQNGLQLGLNPYICVMLGMVSSSFGGVVRDILCEQPPRILYNHSHVYASTALCGSGSYVALKYAGVSPKLRIGLAFTASMMSRYLAWRQDWRLIHWEWVERKKMGHHFQHNET
mmetsp:Transcript_7168/g.9464  ORF Transcript_7168/g.9464 Transcript_7168/m.9464 type:complete len:336 (-) Transcript_7168:629-1636(-)